MLEHSAETLGSDQLNHGADEVEAFHLGHLGDVTQAPRWA